MTKILTAAQMRSIEQTAIESEAVSGLALMERAGHGVVEAIFEEWPDLDTPPRRSVVLCGPGNNGGDGFVIARLLAEHGWQVELFLLGDPAKLPPDAKTNHDRWGMLGAVTPLPDDFDTLPNDVTLVVDALFGTGLTRPFLALGALQSWLSALRSRHGTAMKVVAVDIPSGLCADSGRFLGAQTFGPESCPIQADLTVSFHTSKLGHRLAQGPDACGVLVVKSIGLEDLDCSDAVRLVSAPSWRDLDKKNGHKFNYGHALLMSGGHGHTGAARLAARGALRVGTGMVTLAAPPDALPEIACQITAIMQRPVATATELADALADPRITALALGPALGIGQSQRDLLATALTSQRPTVLDADALTLIAADPALFALLHDRCVLTPHGGEFARLFPHITEKLLAPPDRGPAYSKVDATRAAARQAGCVVLFKGADTLIAAPEGDCALHSAHYKRSAPWLATAGAGDVLCGLICGLMARGFPPMPASEIGAWLHVQAALDFGPGLIAEDLPEALPGVFRSLAVPAAIV